MRKGGAVLIIFFLLVILCPMNGDAQRRNAVRRDVKKTEREARQAPAQQAPAAESAETAAAPAPAQESAAAPQRDARDSVSFLDEPQGQAVEEPESYAWLIFKTILILGMLVAGFYYFFRYVTKKAGMQVHGRDVLNVLAMVPVGPNKFLQIVDMAGRLLVIGVSDNSVNLLTEVRDKEEIDRIRLMSSRSMPVQENTFQDFVAKQIGRFMKKAGPVRARFRSEDEPRPAAMREEPTDRLGYLRKQKDRLQKMNGSDHEN